MPDLDSGHIFLTTMAPIKQGAAPTGSASYTQKIREALAKLPTALQSPATINIGINSPFARNTRTHLARMFVLNDAVFNGRNGRNPLSAALRGEDTTIPQKVDHLNTGYLVFCADIDAIEQAGAPLPKTLGPVEQRRVRDSYARELWSTMEPELREVYENCYGFDAVNTAEDFAVYLDKCHVETTMPFHDYYLELPDFNLLPLKTLVGVIAVPAVVAIVALIAWLFGKVDFSFIGWGTLATAIIGGLITAIAAVISIKYALQNGEKPLAPAKYDDLPSVLKGLYTQQKFSDFVVDHQGVSAQELHKDFARFLQDHKPGDTTAPTQSPGVISLAMQKERSQ